MTDLGVHEEIPETGSTLEENSRLKAQFVWEKFKMPVFSDDSGLEVEVLDGEPGVYSARYAGLQKNAEDNMNLLLSRLRNKEDRTACFKCVITYIDASGLETQFEGRVDGTIMYEKVGEGGFGYDPIFRPKGHTTTFAEMTDHAKNEISHRARALHQFLNFLTNG